MQGVRESMRDESELSRGNSGEIEQVEAVEGATSSCTASLVLCKQSEGDIEVDAKVLPGSTEQTKQDGTQEMVLSSPANEELPEILLYQLAEKIIGSKMVALGLRLEIDYSEIDHITSNNPRDIVRAIFEVLLKWKKGLERDVPVGVHYEKLVAALMKIDQSDEAEWLKSRK